MLKILIIDDNHSFIDTLRVLLKELPIAISIDSCDRYMIANKYLQENNYSLVLLDNETETGMKGMSLIETCIQNYEGYTYDNFIVFSARFDEIANDLKLKGIKGFAKPFKTHDFLQAVQKFLSAIQQDEDKKQAAIEAAIQEQEELEKEKLEKDEELIKKEETENNISDSSENTDTAEQFNNKLQAHFIESDSATDSTKENKELSIEPEEELKSEETKQEKRSKFSFLRRHKSTKKSENKTEDKPKQNNNILEVSDNNLAEKAKTTKKKTKQKDKTNNLSKKIAGKKKISVKKKKSGKTKVKRKTSIKSKAKKNTSTGGIRKKKTKPAVRAKKSAAAKKKSTSKTKSKKAVSKTTLKSKISPKKKSLAKTKKQKVVKAKKSGKNKK